MHTHIYAKHLQYLHTYLAILIKWKTEVQYVSKHGA